MILTKINYTKEQLSLVQYSKSDMFGPQLDCAFDYALPQEWLNEFSKHIDYDLIRTTVVWAYPKEHSTFGVPVTCCEEVFKTWCSRYRD